MKTFMVGLIIIILFGAAGFVGFQYLSRQNQSSTVSNVQSTTLSGVIMTGKGDDYSFVLLDSKGKTTGVTSQTVQFDPYVNKRVEVVGTYSGTTFYAQTITEAN